jgi:transaldolase / glucose-6-phosphate isomerase
MATGQQVNERLAAITEAGTSIWLDQVRRSLVETGELKRMVEEESLRGVTSNPAIFEKAILGSPDYDDQLAELAKAGGDTRGIYRAMAVRDIQEACDVLRPVYDATDHYDGYVSLEVDPDLAFDTDLTNTQAREYWDAVDRPNLMIKIPGTDEGVPAIEQQIYEGRNINVTLLFAVASYERIAEAFIRGMERRHAEGKHLDVHSVASFFVSRVDSEVDKRLEKLGREDLQGRAGLANARAAYKRFKAIFLGERFAALREAGAPVQRPLWASTGVKNPKYSDTMYVDGLIGPHTVNTMPMATLQAAADHAGVTGPTADQDPTPDLQALAEAGIDLDDVTAKLLEDGIDAFVTPMEKLLVGIESKREAIITSRPPAIESSLPDDLEPAIVRRIEEAKAQDVARRIWRKDPTLWGREGQPELADRLGWLTVTETMQDMVTDLEDFAREVVEEGVADVVLLGMGGSSLAPEVLRRSFGQREGFPRLHVLDSTHPDAVRAVEQAIDPQRSLFLVSTKSGGTIETISLFHRFGSLAPEGQRFVAITDPGSGVEELAHEHEFRHIFHGDPEIGGRYSALSAFGLVPAALMGADVRALLESAGVAEQASVAFDSSQANSGLWLGLTLGELAVHGRDKLTFAVDPPLSSFGLWVEQLVAESTGKEGTGILPVADEPLGAADAYGQDRTFVHLRDGDAAEAGHADALEALARAGHPVLTLTAHGPADLGRIFFFAEFATAVAGWVLGINPFDQPNVQEAKDNTKRVLAQLENGGQLQEPPDADDAALRALVDGLAAPHYLAVLGYVPPSEAFDEAVAELRAAVRDATGAATTFGYGPRYLHSTGQLHKGGAGGTLNGRFLELVARPAGDDIEIPGQSFTFGQLVSAQAIGDLETLRGHGRPAERVTLDGDDPAGGLRALTAKIKEML